MADFIKKVFHRKRVEKEKAMIQTSPLSDEIDHEVNNDTIRVNPSQFITGSGQSTGKQRDHNEDALFTLTSTLADGYGGIPFGISIVADGMGGHKNGEMASGTCIRAVSQYILSRVYSHVLDIKGGGMQESLLEIMEQAVSEAQKAVLQNAPGGGTTLTAALILGDHVSIAQVGDSRAYFYYPDGRLQKITKDHSLVQRMVDLEEITEEEAYVHPQKNVLLKAIGQLEPYRADITTYQIPRGGKLLICSDGLWGVIPDYKICEIVANGTDPVSTCQVLVEAANQAGGPDNISVIISDFSTV